MFEDSSDAAHDNNPLAEMATRSVVVHDNSSSKAKAEDGFPLHSQGNTSIKVNSSVHVVCAYRCFIQYLSRFMLLSHNSFGTNILQFVLCKEVLCKFSVNVYAFIFKYTLILVTELTRMCPN